MAKHRGSQLVPYTVTGSEIDEDKHAKTKATLTIDGNRLITDLVDRYAAEATRRAAAEAKLAMIENKAGTPRSAVEVEFEEVLK